MLLKDSNLHYCLPCEKPSHMKGFLKMCLLLAGSILSLLESRKIYLIDSCLKFLLVLLLSQVAMLRYDSLLLTNGGFSEKLLSSHLSFIISFNLNEKAALSWPLAVNSKHFFHLQNHCNASGALVLATILKRWI